MSFFTGHAEQWGNVSRKKDKKPSAISPSPSFSHSGTPPPRDSRGGHRGFQRGGRGGGRGGRGGAISGRPSARDQPASTSAPNSVSVNDSWAANADGSTEEAWGAPSVSNTAAWGDGPDVVSAVEVVAKVEDREVVSSAPLVNGTSKPAAPTPVKAAAPRSWAQVAR